MRHEMPTRALTLLVCATLVACSSATDSPADGAPDGGANPRDGASDSAPRQDAAAPVDAGPVVDQATPGDLAPADAATTADLPTGDALVGACDKLQGDFALLLDALKECTEGCQCCTEEVIGIIFPGCPCPTYVSNAHAPLISQLGKLRADYAQLGCPDKVCKCKQPTHGECLKRPPPLQGFCADRF